MLSWRALLEQAEAKSPGARERLRDKATHLENSSYRLLVPSELSASRIIESLPPDLARSRARPLSEVEEAQLSEREASSPSLNGRRKHSPVLKDPANGALRDALSAEALV